MTEARLRELLRPYIGDAPGEAAAVPADLYSRLLSYLELLLRWNARTNLTAVRESEEIVTRHFGEGLFTAVRLAPWLRAGATLLDVGSGAGFPGLPIQLLYPQLAVTLAESQGKKASFLREVVRALSLNTEIWADRAEAMPQERRFAVVTLRAVDRMPEALALGAARLGQGGILAELASRSAVDPATLFPVCVPQQVPGSVQRVLRLWSPSEK